MQSDSLPAGFVRVRVPATSANLGPGYDSFGLALDWYDEVIAARSDTGLHITVEGIGAGSVPTDERHLVVQAARQAFDAMNEPVPGLDLRCVNTIPHGNGQGSSAAAIVTGILLARALTPDGLRRLSDEAVFALATAMEGHPDNVAPALWGGFTIAWTEPWQRSGGPTAGNGFASAGPRARAVRLTPHAQVRTCVLTARASCSTDTARAALPSQVDHGDAAANAARAALLVYAMTSDPDLLFEATEDRLHQSYRAAMMPQTARLLRTLRDQRIPAVLSGAGPSVLVLGRDSDLARLPEVSEFDARSVEVASSGASVARSAAC